MKVHIGNLIERVISTKSMVKTHVARTIGLKHPQHIFRMFEQDDMSSARIRQFSLALDYNFFYALMLDERLARIKSPVDLSHYKQGDEVSLLLEPDAIYDSLKSDVSEKDAEIARLRGLLVDRDAQIIALQSKVISMAGL